jgi:hypothetical protein
MRFPESYGLLRAIPLWVGDLSISESWYHVQPEKKLHGHHTRVRSTASSLYLSQRLL